MSEVSGKKILYIGVDLQKDFMDKGGALYVSGSEEIKPNIEALMDEIRREGATLWLTRDMHVDSDDEISDSPDFKATFPPHCMRGTSGADFIPEVDMTLVERVYPKNQFSVLTNPNFPYGMTNAMKEFHVVRVFGVAGDVCVRALLNGIFDIALCSGGAYLLPYVEILDDCIASVNPGLFAGYRLTWQVGYTSIAICSAYFEKNRKLEQQKPLDN